MQNSKSLEIFAYIRELKRCISLLKETVELQKKLLQQKDHEIELLHEQIKTA